MPMVLAATGRRAVEALPKYAQQRIRVVQGSRGLPRLYAEKAGLLAPLAVGTAAHFGQEREELLLRTWAEHIERGEYAVEHEAIVDPGSIEHASAVPREWMPLPARFARFIASTPDAWCRSDLDGSLYDVELKCVTSDVFEARWYWVVQVQAQGMSTGSEGAFVVAGSRWARARDWRGPVVRCFVDPDEHMRRELAEAAEEAWSHVAKLKAEMGNADA